MIHHSTKDFTFNAGSRTFVGEVSTLTEGGVKPLHGPIYGRGSPDQGFTLVSHKTNSHAKFKFVYVRLDSDDDIIAWVYKPADLIMPEGTLNTEIHILNT